MLQSCELVKVLRVLHCFKWRLGDCWCSWTDALQVNCRWSVCAVVGMRVTNCDGCLLCLKHTIASALIRGWRRNATRVRSVKMSSVVVMATRLQQLAKRNRYCMHRTTRKMQESLTMVRCNFCAIHIRFCVEKSFQIEFRCITKLSLKSLRLS